MINIVAGNLTLMVSDLDKSIKFYLDVLGFVLINRYGAHYAQISAPGIVIGLHPAKGNLASSDNVSIGFTIVEFHIAKSILDKFAVAYTERKEPGGDFIHFNDPDGYALYLIDQKS